MDGGESALSLKPGPSEMDDNYANDHGIPIPFSCLHSLNFIFSVRSYSKHGWTFSKGKSPCCLLQPRKRNPTGANHTASAFVLHLLSYALGAHRDLQVQRQSMSEWSLAQV